MTSAVDERKITSALVILRQNGTVLITVTADLQLQAEGTWKASASSPEEILLKITGGVLKGEMTGSGKLLLTSDRKSFKELTMNVKLSDGQEVTVTFVADGLRTSKVEDMNAGALHGTHLGLPASTLESRIRVLKINKNRFR